MLVGYPRPPGRGPIEANEGYVNANGGFNYPRPPGRGPIEAA